ncbi:MAG TPA: hypothetical protein VFR61_02895 [Nitrososphaeraceae archaeon]|nr:hypothetical protein [Nitrososphaeraceae archaeon]
MDNFLHIKLMLISPVVLIACDYNVDAKRNNLNLESSISQREQRQDLQQIISITGTADLV